MFYFILTFVIPFLLFSFSVFIHPSMRIQACMHAMCFCNHHPGSEPGQLCRQVKIGWPRYAMWGGSLNTVASFNSNIIMQYKNWWLSGKLDMEKRSSHYSCRWVIHLKQSLLIPRSWCIWIQNSAGASGVSHHGTLTAYHGLEKY